MFHFVNADYLEFKIFFTLCWIKAEFFIKGGNVDSFLPQICSWKSCPSRVCGIGILMGRGSVFLETVVEIVCLGKTTLIFLPGTLAFSPECYSPDLWNLEHCRCLSAASVGEVMLSSLLSASFHTGQRSRGGNILVVLVHLTRERLGCKVTSE